MIKEDLYEMGWIINAINEGDQSFYDYMGVNFSFNEIEIIGNIYEDPKLIE